MQNALPQDNRILSRLIDQVSDTNIIALDKILRIAAAAQHDPATIHRAIGIRDRMQVVMVEVGRCL